MTVKNPEHAALVVKSKTDYEFNAWVLQLSPRDVTGRQPVFFEEAFLILKILWAIYQALKSAGVFSRFMVRRQVRKALLLSTIDAKEQTLLGIRDALLAKQEQE